MNCTECQEAENRFLDGELSPDRSARMFEHAASCAECRRFIHSLVRLNGELMRIPPVLPARGKQSMVFSPSTNSGPGRIWHHRFSVGVPAFALTLVMVAIVAALSFSHLRKPAPVYVTELPTLIVSPDSAVVASHELLH